MQQAAVGGMQSQLGNSGSGAPYSMESARLAASPRAHPHSATPPPASPLSSLSPARALALSSLPVNVVPYTLHLRQPRAAARALWPPHCLPVRLARNWHSRGDDRHSRGNGVACSRGRGLPLRAPPSGLCCTCQHCTPTAAKLQTPNPPCHLPADALAGCRRLLQGRSCPSSLYVCFCFICCSYSCSGPRRQPLRHSLSPWVRSLDMKAAPRT